MSEQEIITIISENIKAFMRRKGLTQIQVADYIGISEAAVSAWCNGKKTPRMNKIDKLCELFGCTRTEIMSKDGVDLMLKRNRSEALQSIYDKHRILFDAAENATEEEIRQAVDYLNYIKNKK